MGWYLFRKKSPKSISFCRWKRTGTFLKLRQGNCSRAQKKRQLAKIAFKKNTQFSHCFPTRQEGVPKSVGGFLHFGDKGQTGHSKKMLISTLHFTSFPGGTTNKIKCRVTNVQRSFCTFFKNWHLQKSYLSPTLSSQGQSSLTSCCGISFHLDTKAFVKSFYPTKSWDLHPALHPGFGITIPHCSYKIQGLDATSVRAQPPLQKDRPTHTLWVRYSSAKREDVQFGNQGHQLDSINASLKYHMTVICLLCISSTNILKASEHRAVQVCAG